ncbi:hypothetical protein ACMT9Y_10600 [Clavibacter tessellarius]|uniref:hypothetical protein n=1 Tax=Clavibacter tessellarius TaxID=31965 RepID=UPI0039EAA6AC
MESNNNNGILSIRWKSLSIVLAIAALACVTSTIIVAAIKNVDALSVVALALAIIAFVVQILVYILQTASTEGQTQHWSDLYTKMNAALATIEEKSERTRDAVSRLDPQQVKQAINKANFEATATDGQSPSPDPSDTEPSISPSISDRVADILTPRPTPERRRARSTANRAPSKSFTDIPVSRPEFQWASDVAATLSDVELSSIRSLGTDQQGQEQAGADMIGYSTLNAAESLHSKGLIIRRRVEWSSKPVFQLTTTGVLVAHLLISPPDYAQDLSSYLTAKAKLDAFDRVRKEMRDARERDASAIPISE